MCTTIDTRSQREARRAAADAIRRLTPLIAWGLIPEAELRTTADALDALANRLSPHARSSRYDGTNGIRLDAEDGGAGNESLWESHCVLGQSHPYAPPVVVDTSSDLISGRVHWTAAYEGQRGFVHGGALASALDVVLGHAAAKGGRPVVTGTMTLLFLQPVPIDVDVTLTARLVEVNGRKILVEGTIIVHGEIAVEADATFVTVTGKRFGTVRP